MLETIYQSAVARDIYFAVVCWEGGRIRARDASRINKLIHKAGLITGQNMKAFESVRVRRSVNKLLSIMENPSHLLHSNTSEAAELLLLRLI